jgi:hypothetical protein
VPAPRDALVHRIDELDLAERERALLVEALAPKAAHRFLRAKELAGEIGRDPLQR